jgi:carbonic anhydrase/acetyltransferase-like protein (isoleucine patch superfamily)
VVGDVEMGDACTVWFNAVVRGDVQRIRMGSRVNVQDAAVLHCTYQKAPLALGNDVSIGHGAIVHGCTVEDNVLIGMGAKVLDHAHLEPWVLVGAGALVPPGARLESGWVYAGLPAKKLRPLTDDERALITRTAQNYVMYASWFQPQ